VDVTGIDNHQIDSLKVVDASAKIVTQRGEAIGIFQQYAYHGKGRTIHSSGQIEWYKGNTVHDRSLKVGGAQHIRTLDGYVLPIDIDNGLPYIFCLVVKERVLHRLIQKLALGLIEFCIYDSISLFFTDSFDICFIILSVKNTRANFGANDRRLPPPLGGGRSSSRIAASASSGLGCWVGWLVRLAANGVVAPHHVFNGGSDLVAFARVGAGGAVMVRKPGHSMSETVVGENRSFQAGHWGRPACPSHVGVVLHGDGGLALEFLVSMVEGCHEIGPRVL